jgi:hypothetical protein
MSRKIETILLAPLTKRAASLARVKSLNRALTRLEGRAFASAWLQELSDAAKVARQRRNWYEDPEAVRICLAQIQALFNSRRISGQEYTFLASVAVEGVHEARIVKGEYADVVVLDKKIEEVERNHGLARDEYWRIGEGPKEYDDLNAKYDKATQAQFADAFCEFGLDHLATLVRDDLPEFDRYRERGRRAFHHKTAITPIILDIVARYEFEARKAASVGAFTAAVVLLAAALEGLLALRCLRSRRKAAQHAAALPKSKRPKDCQEPTTWTFEALIDTCRSADWLPVVQMETMVVNPDALAHILRKMRNNVHPGRMAKDRPWAEVDAHDYADADAIYSTLFATVSGIRGRSKLKDAVDQHESKIL